jgi:hypothetical protein
MAAAVSVRANSLLALRRARQSFLEYRHELRELFDGDSLNRSSAFG